MQRACYDGVKTDFGSQSTHKGRVRPCPLYHLGAGGAEIGITVGTHGASAAGTVSSGFSEGPCLKK